ncbi:hypothetical protein GCM10011344_10740 [Dokdonia pacifica]|uniref:Uncharacterized protein n=1 Tax=Dokdonia pacifica TaxID=1627892 RepID=A0A238YJN1_9FLAO|nr:hypothetical protein [Dokdonia pacifica]GGG11888.1 hypothetical protein GCM10011344_10740 [Dokdonia pacifica]SNR71260.1 hypothetical protein SAMN06265376_102121 [Dokdonia pacifica]
MLKNIVNLNGVKELNNAQLKNTNGGIISEDHAFACIRTKDGVSHTFYGNQSEASATAWVNAWGSLGWDASCGHEAHR